MKRIFQILLLVTFAAGIRIAVTAAEDDTALNPAIGEGRTEVAKGPHGGRLLGDAKFRIELSIFETGVEPQFRAYAFSANRPLDPRAVQLDVDLARLGGKVERFRFTPVDDYLLGSGTVAEPHSFTIRIVATHGGKMYEWNYDSFEGRTRIEKSMADESGISTAIAGPATIRETLVLHGKIVPDPQRVYPLQGRFPGVVKEVRKRIGDPVRAGEVLAVIEANESLRNYNLVAPASGIVATREVNPGLAVANEVLLTIVDLSSVWVELAAFQHDMGRVMPGQPVIVRDVDAHESVEGRVDSIAPLGSSASQSMTLRVVVPNAKGAWRPGLFVTGEVTVAESEVPLAVQRNALQAFRDWTVVFEKVGDDYEVRPLTLGRNDAQQVEVLHGIAPGAVYVGTGSYLIKADIEKSGASHDH